MQKDKASIEDLYTDLINLGRIFDVEKRAKNIEQYKLNFYLSLII